MQHIANTPKESPIFANQYEKLKLKNPVKDQLMRASLSVALNITEGSGRLTPRDQRKFYGIAMGLLRESQTLVKIIGNDNLIRRYDHLGRLLYGLLRKTSCPYPPPEKQ